MLNIYLVILRKKKYLINRFRWKGSDKLCSPGNMTTVKRSHIDWVIK